MATQRKRTVTQERARLELFQEAKKAQLFLEVQKMKEGLIPPDWVKESDEMVSKRKKVELTLDLDEDVAKWFQRTGAGYGDHINTVLRMFMLNVIAKEQEGFYDRAFGDGKPL